MISNIITSPKTAHGVVSLFYIKDIDKVHCLCHWSDKVLKQDPISHSKCHLEPWYTLDTLIFDFTAPQNETNITFIHNGCFSMVFANN